MVYRIKDAIDQSMQRKDANIIISDLSLYTAGNLAETIYEVIKQDRKITFEMSKKDYEGLWRDMKISITTLLGTYGSELQVERTDFNKNYSVTYASPEKD